MTQLTNVSLRLKDLEMITIDDTTMVDMVKNDIVITSDRLMEVNNEMLRMGDYGKKPKYNWAIQIEDYGNWRRENRERREMKKLKRNLEWTLQILKSTLIIFEDGY